MATQSSNGAPGHINGLDAIRGVCACWVMMYHLGGYWLSSAADYQGHPLQKLLFLVLNNSFNGPAAVMVFFILSGVVVHYPNRAKAFSLGEFWTRRYVRVGGPMLAAIGLAHAVALFGATPNLPTWSLYCELIFYALYPALLLLARRWGWGPLLLISCILAFALTFVPEHHGGQFWTYGFGLTWILGYPLWIGGAWLSENFDKAPARPTSRTMLLMRLAIWGFSAICLPLGYHKIIPFTQSLLLFGVPSAIWLAFEVNYAVGRPSNARLDWLGTISYSIYLCHALVPPIFASLGLTTAGFGIFLAMVCAAMAISVVFYYSIEVKFHRLARNLSKIVPALTLVDGVRRKSAAGESIS